MHSPSVTRFFHPVLRARRLRKKPRQVRIAGEAYVLFRDRQGRPGALVDRCPHRFAPLSRGRVRPDGRLACPYHGWHFDRDGHGCAPSHPRLTRCDATAMRVVERSGYLWIGGPDADADAIPTFSDSEDYAFGGGFSVLFRAPLHVCLDNFSEDEHVAWVHTRLAWSASQLDSIEFNATNHADRTEVYYRGRQRPSVYLPLFQVYKDDVFHNRWETLFDPVRATFTMHWTDPKTDEERPARVRTTVYMVPETAHTTWFHVFPEFGTDEQLSRLLPRRVLLGLGRMLAKKEVRDDARFLPIMAETPESMAGMRLARFDKPLIHNRKLLRQIYWGRADSDGPP